MRVADKQGQRQTVFVAPAPYVGTEHAERLTRAMGQVVARAAALTRGVVLSVAVVETKAGTFSVRFVLARDRPQPLDGAVIIKDELKGVAVARVGEPPPEPTVSVAVVLGGQHPVYQTAVPTRPLPPLPRLRLIKHKGHIWALVVVRVTRALPCAVRFSLPRLLVFAFLVRPAQTTQRAQHPSGRTWRTVVSPTVVVVEGAVEGRQRVAAKLYPAARLSFSAHPVVAHQAAEPLLPLKGVV